MLLVVDFRTMYLETGKAAFCHTISPPPPYSITSAAPFIVLLKNISLQNYYKTTTYIY
jgi:hypothetical protein